MENLITPDEAANFLGVSKKTLWVYRTKHKNRKLIKKYVISPKNVRYCRDSLQVFIERSKSA
ncbi:helix-turn-helix domain-containing protein [Shewanella sp. JM162201]|uniref:Helix-turn-helix domain-containing protein n=1 Tax=Shewanella jiangmenensis TaxID=2837387 RepID=A0ABS5UZ43_9GAMM|nr:helix-turn-helix domain-containing protein [Shewanella jiangmenensis]MBT1443437.1 helix-turn-helix domain-containing protein [Shewanella jiangmenensis]